MAIFGLKMDALAPAQASAESLAVPIAIGAVIIAVAALAFAVYTRHQVHVVKRNASAVMPSGKTAAARRQLKKQRKKQRQRRRRAEAARNRQAEEASPTGSSSDASASDGEDGSDSGRSSPSAQSVPPARSGESVASCGSAASDSSGGGAAVAPSPRRTRRPAPSVTSPITLGESADDAGANDAEEEEEAECLPTEVVSDPAPTASSDSDDALVDAMVADALNASAVSAGSSGFDGVITLEPRLTPSTCGVRSPTLNVDDTYTDSDDSDDDGVGAPPGFETASSARVTPRALFGQVPRSPTKAKSMSSMPSDSSLTNDHRPAMKRAGSGSFLSRTNASSIMAAGAVGAPRTAAFAALPPPQPLQLNMRRVTQRRTLDPRPTFAAKPAEEQLWTRALGPHGVNFATRMRAHGIDFDATDFLRTHAPVDEVPEVRHYSRSGGRLTRPNSSHVMATELAAAAAAAAAAGDGLSGPPGRPSRLRRPASSGATKPSRHRGADGVPLPGRRGRRASTGSGMSGIGRMGIAGGFR